MIMIVHGKVISHAALGGAGMGLVGAITQSDFTLWSGGLILVGGAILYLLDRRRRDTMAANDLARRNAIETDRLQHEAILQDAKAEMQRLRDDHAAAMLAVKAEHVAVMAAEKTEVRELRRELHDVRDEGGILRTKLALAEYALGQAKTPTTGELAAAVRENTQAIAVTAAQLPGANNVSPSPQEQVQNR